jgi:hypothetical protein
MMQSHSQEYAAKPSIPKLYYVSRERYVVAASIEQCRWRLLNFQSKKLEALSAVTLHNMSEANSETLEFTAVTTKLALQCWQVSTIEQGDTGHSQVTTFTGVPQIWLHTTIYVVLSGVGLMLSDFYSDMAIAMVCILVDVFQIYRAQRIKLYLQRKVKTILELDLSDG